MNVIPIRDVAPVYIGQAENVQAGTGCTVFISPDGMRAGLDVRGGGPASRESQILNPMASAQAIHGIVLAGGSAFGLGAADGVMKYLEEKGIGFDVGNILEDHFLRRAHHQVMIVAAPVHRIVFLVGGGQKIGRVGIVVFDRVMQGNAAAPHGKSDGLTVCCIVLCQPAVLTGRVYVFHFLFGELLGGKHVRGQQRQEFRFLCALEAHGRDQGGIVVADVLSAGIEALVFGDLFSS